jgi:hypothetical protein
MHCGLAVATTVAWECFPNYSTQSMLMNAYGSAAQGGRSLIKHLYTPHGAFPLPHTIPLPHTNKHHQSPFHPKSFKYSHKHGVHHSTHTLCCCCSTPAEPAVQQQPSHEPYVHHIALCCSTHTLCSCCCTPAEPTVQAAALHPQSLMSIKQHSTHTLCSWCCTPGEPVERKQPTQARTQEPDVHHLALSCSAHTVCSCCCADAVPVVQQQPAHKPDVHHSTLSRSTDTLCSCCRTPANPAVQAAALHPQSLMSI